MDQFFKDLLDTMKDRVKNTLFSSFIISWLAWNWKYIYVTFFVSEKGVGGFTNKFEYILSIKPSIYNWEFLSSINYMHYQFWIFPLITALAYVFAGGFINWGVSTFTEMIKVMTNNSKTKMTNKKVYSNEYVDEEIEKARHFDLAEIKDKTTTIESLKNQLERLEEETKNNSTNEEIQEDFRKSETMVGVLKAQKQLLEDKLSENDIDISDLFANLDEKFDQIGDNYETIKAADFQDQLESSSQSKEGKENEESSEPPKTISKIINTNSKKSSSNSKKHIPNIIEIINSLSADDKNSLLKFNKGLESLNEKARIEQLSKTELSLFKELKIIEDKNDELQFNPEFLALFVQSIEEEITPSINSYVKEIVADKNIPFYIDFHDNIKKSGLSISEIDNLIDKKYFLPKKHIHNNEFLTFLSKQGFIEYINKKYIVFKGNFKSIYATYKEWIKYQDLDDLEGDE